MKKWFTWILKLSITSGILYYIFTIIPFSEVIKSITSAKLSYIVIALSIMAFMAYTEAYRMKILTDKQGMSLSIRQIIEINLATRFYGLFLPGLASGAIRWYKLSRPDNKSAEALAFMAFSRLIDTIVLVMLGILFWALDITSRSNYIIGLSLLTILSGLLITHFLVFNGEVSCFLWKRLGQINLSVIPEMMRSKISKLLISTSEYHSLSRSLLIYISGLSLTRHLLGIFAFYLFALSLGINLSIINVGWVRSFILIIAMLPVSFAGLGVREGTLIFLLKPYGVPATDAVALSFLIFARALLGVGIGGLFEARKVFSPTRSRSGVRKKIST
jgi:hypothetical protein